MAVSITSAHLPIPVATHHVDGWLVAACGNWDHERVDSLARAREPPWTPNLGTVLGDRACPTRILRRDARIGHRRWSRKMECCAGWTRKRTIGALKRGGFHDTGGLGSSPHPC